MKTHAQLLAENARLRARVAELEEELSSRLVEERAAVILSHLRSLRGRTASARGIASALEESGLPCGLRVVRRALLALEERGLIERSTDVIDGVTWSGWRSSAIR